MSDKKQEDEIRARILVNLSFLIKVGGGFHNFEKGMEELGGFLVDYDIVGLLSNLLKQSSFI